MHCVDQGVKVGMVGKQNERNFDNDNLAFTAMFGLFFYIRAPNQIKLLLFSNAYLLRL